MASNDKKPKINKLQNHKVISFIRDKHGDISQAGRARLELSDETEAILSTDDADGIDPILVDAEYIIETILLSGNLSLSRLTREQMNKLAYFFFKRNPTVRRAISLKTRIPMSVINLVKPKHKIDIVQDYVFNFYNKCLNTAQWKQGLIKAAFHMHTFGRAIMIFESDYSYETDIIIDEDAIRDFRQKVIMTPEVRTQITKINDKYNESPDQITREEIEFVLKHTFPLLTEFTGIKRMKTISPFDIVTESYNGDTGFRVIELEVSPYVKKFVEETSREMHSTQPDISDEEIYDNIISSLQGMGYTRAAAELHTNAVLRGESTISITNDATDDIWFVEFTSEELGDDFTPLISSMEALISQYNFRRKSMMKTDSVDKVVKMLSSDEASPEELEKLSDDITTAVEQGDYSVVVANYGLSVEDIEFAFKTQLEPEFADELSNDVITGLGVPEGLLNASDTYGSSFIQIQTLNIEMQQFVDEVTTLIQRKLFVAIANKKGLLSFNLFGDIEYVTPMISFYKGSILSDDYIDTLKDLVKDGKLPRRILYEQILGLDQEEIVRELKEEKKQFPNENNNDGF